MSPLDLYLQKVAHAMRAMPASRREDELRELRLHLEQRIEDFVAQGLSVMGAQERTLNEFGSARALGLKLYDQWESGPFSWRYLLLTTLRVSLFWFLSLNLLYIGWHIVQYWEPSALFPEIPYEFLAAIAVVPFWCGWLLSCSLGRRGRLVTFVCFALLLSNTRGDDLFPITFSSVLILNMASAMTGSVVGYALQRKRIEFVLESRSILAPTPSALFPTKWRWYGLRICLIGVIGALLWARVSLALHPTTPNGAFRLFLANNRQMNIEDFEQPTILEIHELPATTSAEFTGREKKLDFRLEVHATRSYAQRRIDFLKSSLASPSARNSWGTRELRLSLARLQRNSHEVRGTVRLIKTSGGWQVDRKSFDVSQLWAWCYDIYYER